MIEAYRFSQHPNKFGTFRPRPDKTHFTAQNINHLRQLVEVSLSQQPTDLSNSRIILSRPLRPSAFRTHSHATEFQKLKRLPHPAHPLLPKNYRPGRLKSDRNRG